jgi:deazaflavin-dependent oxidoreductase (nitroreductase family)
MPIPKRVAHFNKRVTNRVTRHIAGWMPGFAIVTHVGRRSGRTYHTPVNVFEEDGRYVFALTYGPDSDWVRNVIAAGGCQIETRSRRVELADPRRFTDESRHAVPVPARWILRLANVDEFLSLAPRRSVLDEVRASRAPAGVRTRIVAVDGPGGAGKTTLARWLAEQIDAQVIQTDDFASWENPIDWWPRLLELALEPLAKGTPACFQPTSWGGEEREPVQIKPAGTVILEGVSASREAFQPFLAYSIWVETPRDVRLQRGLERDGAEARARWEQWMEEEDLYMERELPAERANLVVRGDQDLWMT